MNWVRRHRLLAACTGGAIVLVLLVVGQHALFRAPDAVTLLPTDGASSSEAPSVVVELEYGGAAESDGIVRDVGDGSCGSPIDERGRLVPIGRFWQFDRHVAVVMSDSTGELRDVRKLGRGTAETSAGGGWTCRFTVRFRPHPPAEPRYAIRVGSVALGEVDVHEGRAVMFFK